MKFNWHWLLFWFFTICSTPVIPAEDALSQIDSQLKALQNKISEIKNKENLSDTQKVKLLDIYYAAEDNLEEQQQLAAQNRELVTQSKRIPDEIHTLEKQIKEAEKALNREITEKFSDLSADALEQRLITEKNALNALDSTIASLEIQQNEQLKKPQEIRQKIADTKKKITDNQAQQASTKDSKQAAEALAILTESQTAKLKLYESWLDLEDLLYPLKIRQQKLKLQLLNLQREQLFKTIQHMDSTLTENHQREINKARTYLRQAEEQISGQHEIIQQIANENIHYAQLLLAINEKLKKFARQKDQFESRYTQLDKDFRSAEQKIDLAGLSPALGNLLREQHRTLPTASDFSDLSEKIQQEIATANLTLFELDEAQTALLNVEQRVDTLVRTKFSELDHSEKLAASSALRMLLNQQKDLVGQLSPLFSEYARLLVDNDFALQQLLTLSESYRRYLDKRLLWVPSAPAMGLSFFGDLITSLQWFVKPAHWQQLAIDLRESIFTSPVLTVLGLSLLLTLLRVRKDLKEKLAALLEKSRKPYSDRLNFTFLGFGYVFLLALPFAGLLMWFANLVLINNQASNFTRLIASGLWAATMPLLILQFFYQIFKPQGLVQTLFNWPEDNVKLLFRQIKWIRWVVIPGVFLINMFANDMYSMHSYVFGRSALIVNMLIQALVFHRFAHPDTGLAKTYYQNQPLTWLTRLRYVSYVAVVLIPLVILAFAVSGYYQSALELQGKLVMILRILFFSALFHAVVIRWLNLTNRKLALQNARQKRKQQGQTASAAAEGQPVITQEEEALLNIPKINQQSRTVLTTVTVLIIVTGLWLTLQDIFPALSIFDQVVLWQHYAEIDGKETLQPITLINLFICLLYFVLMIVFVSNFPGLIDLLFIGRYSITAGSRYALLQLTRYAVITLTFILIANELGGSWSQVQWLVAALGVGLGFGLQEIFANFVSGIILLFERPIRVGDTVTVADVHGNVTRISMRATTIVDWDRKELIVPNKIFITDKLINWTLSDTVTRVVIQVGISYNADEETATRIFRQILEESPLVLDDPKPNVFFLGFGDSSLDFQLMVYVRELADRLKLTDELHRRIRKAFKEHGIEIPFPQRDVHVYSTSNDTLGAQSSPDNQRLSLTDQESLQD